MIKLFRIFFSKTLILVYSATLFLTLFLGCVNVYNIKQHSVEFSTAFLIFSILAYFILFFVLESNRIYQFFRTVDFRLLPISTGKLYVYNVIFSSIVGIIFFIGNATIGLIINYFMIKIPFVLDITWLKGITAVIDIVVLFLMIQFLICIYASIKQFVQKRFRWILEIVLFIVFMFLIDYLSVWDLDILKRIVISTFGLKQEIYFRLITQLVIAGGYFSLSIWLIDRYVEAGDR